MIGRVPLMGGADGKGHARGAVSLVANRGLGGAVVDHRDQAVSAISSSGTWIPCNGGLTDSNSSNSSTVEFGRHG